MAQRLAHEPAYPQTQAELDAYCERFIEALRRELGSHLIGVLLCGSWARGEATPAESDADLTVIVDTLSDATSDALCRAWRQADMGCANI
jgi:predicted nucleotidyltransferase